VIVRMDETGKVLDTERVLNDRVGFALAVAEAGEGPEVGPYSPPGHMAPRCAPTRRRLRRRRVSQGRRRTAPRSSARGR
jgi:hypothetical protein